MEWLPYLTGIFVIIYALVARGRASTAASAVEDVSREAQRRIATVEEELRGEIDTLKRLLVKVASGVPLTAEMITEGQLWRDIGVDEALTIAGEGAFILDIRTRQETDLGVVQGATLIPMDEIEERTAEIPRDGSPILVYCAAGIRSAAVCEHLTREGFDGLLNLEAGFGAWTGATERPSNR